MINTKTVKHITSADLIDKWSADMGSNSAEWEANVAELDRAAAEQKAGLADGSIVLIDRITTPYLVK
jgi:hypothetical protein